MLIVENLCYKNILKNITFTLEDGSFTLLAGKNGSGKSCLLRCIQGLYKHTGTVKCSGKTGLVFQDADTQIIGQTVKSDLEFGLKNIKAGKMEIEDAVKQISSDFGIEPLMDRRPSTLSGGEKRRVAIADIMVLKPNVLLLDEPFANLDYEGVKSVLKYLIKLNKNGITILLVSHEVEKVLALADRLIILDSGRTAVDGEVKKIFSDTNFEKYGIHVSGPLESMKWM